MKKFSNFNEEKYVLIRAEVELKRVDNETCPATCPSEASAKEEAPCVTERSRVKF